MKLSNLVFLFYGTYVRIRGIPTSSAPRSTIALFDEDDIVISFWARYIQSPGN